MRHPEAFGIPEHESKPTKNRTMSVLSGEDVWECAICPQSVVICDKCGREKGCNADCEDMNCEHCYCYREGRDG